MAQHKFSVALAHKPTGASVRPGSLPQLRQDLYAFDLKDARDAGYQAGFDEAHQAAAKAFDLAVERLDQAREEALDALSTSAVELAVEIARQIVRVEIQAGNYDLERMIRGALSQSSAGRGEAMVHLCPKDHDTMQAITFRNKTEISIDTTLQPGDVHVQTSQGLLVREVSECLASVREQLLEDLN